jgi:hypothetical protein
VDYFVGPPPPGVPPGPLNQCTFYANSITLNCPPMTSLPKVGQISTQNSGSAYRTLDELTPGATPFAVQFGARFQF